MKLAKMRHQRGRVRPTVRPTDLSAHPDSRLSWQQEVVVLDHGRAKVICSHCKRDKPCPTEEYLHGQEGHDFERCGGSDRCYLFERARYAREHELVP